MDDRTEAWVWEKETGGYVGTVSERTGNTGKQVRVREREKK